MLSVGWFVAAIVAAVVLAVVLTMWITFTLTRLDRLHARVDAAQAALDTQLVRRAMALQHVAGDSDTGDSRLADIANVALNAGRETSAEGAARETAENAVGRAVRELARAPSESVVELREAAARVLIARRFYNDAVRDTRSLRGRRLPRVFRMAGRREMPQFFDIDDTLPDKEP